VDRQHRLAAMRSQLRHLQPRAEQIEALNRRLGREEEGPPQPAAAPREEHVKSSEECRQERIAQLSQQLHDVGMTNEMAQRASPTRTEPFTTEGSTAMQERSSNVQDQFMASMESDMSSGRDSKTARLVRNMPADQLAYMMQNSAR